MGGHSEANGHIPDRLRAGAWRSLRFASRTAYRVAGAQPSFVIVTNGRTGSQLLVSLLDSHPGIVCDGEILARPTPFPGQVVLRRSARAKRNGCAYGFKLLLKEAEVLRPDDPPGLLRSFHERGFRIIRLERRDLLQLALSGYRTSGALRPWAAALHHRRHDVPDFSAAAVDPMGVLAGLYLGEHSAKVLDAALEGLPVLRLVYEDDLLEADQQQRTIDRVCGWLGIAPAPVRTDLVRITPRSIADQIENFDEVAELLSHTRYAQLLPDRAPQTLPDRAPQTTEP